MILGYQPWTHCLFFSAFPVAITHLCRSPKPLLRAPTVYTQRLSTFTLPKASFKESTQLIDVSLLPDLPLPCTYSIFLSVSLFQSTGKSIYRYKLTFSTVNVHRKTGNTNQCRIALFLFPLTNLLCPFKPVIIFLLLGGAYVYCRRIFTPTCPLFEEDCADRVPTIYCGLQFCFHFDQCQHVSLRNSEQYTPRLEDY